MKPQNEDYLCNRFPGSSRCIKLIKNRRCSQKNQLKSSRQCINGDCKDLAVKTPEN
jgi:hypothetical protein